MPAKTRGSMSKGEPRSAAPLLVSTLLNGIGLDQSVIDKFGQAGIVTSDDLVELETDFFGALGVTSDKDRKKLFFLVQRVKLQVEKENAKLADAQSSGIDGFENGESDAGPTEVRNGSNISGLSDGTGYDGGESERPVASKRASKTNNVETSAVSTRRTSRRLQENNSNPSETSSNDDQKSSPKKRVSKMQAPRRSTRNTRSSIPSVSSIPSILSSSSQQIDEDSALDDEVKDEPLKSHHRQLPVVAKGSSESLDQLLQSSCSEDSRDFAQVSRIAENDFSEIVASNPQLNDSQVSNTKRRQRRKTTVLPQPRARKARPSDVTSAVRTQDNEESAPFRGFTVSNSGGNSNNFKEMIECMYEDVQAEYEMFAGEKHHDFDENTVMRIRVVVRKRPVSKMEANVSGGGIDIIHPLDYGDYGKVLVYQPKTRVDLTKQIETVPFAFDNVFGESSTNENIYHRSIRNLIHPFFQGQWGTVFAYGQTGSGKTYTMMGSNMTGMNRRKLDGEDSDDVDEEASSSNFGLYYLAALDIFTLAERPEFAHLSIGVSLFEIYGGKLYDLLNSRNQVKCLEDRRGKVCFPGLTEHPISNPEDLIEMIETGNKNRSTGTTSRNADSSRSHAVLQLNLKRKEGRRKIVEHSRLTFIDLAGSERGADTNSASRATRLEGAEINTSLLALKEVIRALASGGSMTHIPFRGSKLTQVLKDSFVGDNARCCMVACISPDIVNCEQTLNTLRYADRVKERHSETGALSGSVYNDTQTFPGFFLPSKSTAPVPVATNKPAPSDSKTAAKTAVEETSPTYEDVDENDAGDYFLSEEDADDYEFIEKNDSDDHSRGKLARSSSTGSDTAILEGLLSTPRNGVSVDEQDGGRQIDFETLSPVPPMPAPTTSSRISRTEAGQELARAHRSVMAAMLSMVKQEMRLVNSVEEDRDKFDVYLTEAYRLQESQLEHIEHLQAALLEYRNVSSEASGDIPVIESDNSFEDLRD